MRTAFVYAKMRKKVHVKTVPSLRWIFQKSKILFPDLSKFKLIFRMLEKIHPNSFEFRLMQLWRRYGILKNINFQMQLPEKLGVWQSRENWSEMEKILPFDLIHFTIYDSLNSKICVWPHHGGVYSLSKLADKLKCLINLKVLLSLSYNQ